MKLLENARFYTMKKEGDYVDNVLLDGGKIQAVNVNPADYPTATRLDLNGDTVFPGFVDSHIHLLWYGQALDRLNLNETKTKQEAIEQMIERKEMLTEGEWLFVEGYDENKWTDDNTLLTANDLDQVSETVPVLVRRIDYHSVSINHAFLNAISLTKDASFSGGGEIVVDENGELTGILKDNATDLAIQAFKAPTTKEMSHWLTLAIQDLFKKGITGAHSEDLHYFNGFKGTLDVFRQTITAKMPFRAQLLIHHAELGVFKQEKERFMDGNEFVELDAVKIFFDGTVGSRTAYMSMGYADSPDNHGLKIHSDEEFIAIVKEARKLELPVAIHILGDAAFSSVLSVLKKYPPKSGLHDRMIHTPWLTDELIEEAKDMPLLFDIQPQFMASDLPWALDVLGENYPKRAFAWKTLLKNNLTLAFGSDAPIEIPNPFYGIHAAVTRTTNHDLNGKAYFENEALTTYEAISLYTTGSAKASYKPFSRGKIAPGYDADLTVVATNPFEVPNSDLRDIKVTQTFVSGEKVY
ncbi:amidohydrolase [Listeria fleischmannii]|uniref:Amidohydrolase n=1 Tax=Listeria fleischmannii TaxID=1069827 RepID=A0A841YBK1_9LIST|nr:amidohydrolase [Listeria fleischmannii]MBC1397598.1 amidohydrolase [Listeria fleischmannii]MBC1426861.1 amidohydrolase [Listeria fleischmannii]STY33680.1 N-substituted formamide deformylase precursor [Listeria fleischmannii subsp. coloradonensis]